MTNTLPVLIDVDTGCDDALALLLALGSPALDVRGITCVAGNHRLEQVVRNTLTLLDAVDAPPLPVAAGLDRALLDPGLPLPALHGADGMGDLGLPAPRRKPHQLHAVEFMHRTLTDATAPLTVICLAPLTNIAVLLRMYPEIRPQIKRLVVMGGTFAEPGNTTAAAEFNIRCDPEAAAIVLHSDLPITLYPLDPFRQVRFSRIEGETLSQSHSMAAAITGGIVLHSCNYFQAEYALLGDAGAVAAVIDPAGARIERHPVQVELTGASTRGATVFDRRTANQRARTGTDWAEIEVITSVDADRYRRLMIDAIGAGDRHVEN